MDYYVDFVYNRVRNQHRWEGNVTHGYTYCD